jgi:hypothetical protein
MAERRKMVEKMHGLLMPWHKAKPGTGEQPPGGGAGAFIG